MENTKGIEKNSAKQIKAGAVISYIAVAVSIAFGIIYTPWIISRIGKENYGLYTTAIYFIAFFTRRKMSYL